MRTADVAAADALRTANLRATAQRVVLLSALRRSPTPLTVDTLVRKAEGKLDAATAYRALQEFEQSGLAQRVARPGGSSLYEATGAHHHHLTCRICGLIEDVRVCLPPSVHSKLLRSSKRFARVEDHALEFIGVCETCVAKSA